MFSLWLMNWMAPLTFLSDKERMFCAELLSILSLFLLAYLIAKTIKVILHLVAERKFFEQRWPRMIEAVKKSHLLGGIGYALSAVLVIHLYTLFIPSEGALLQKIIFRLVGIYTTLCFLQVFISSINVADCLYGRNPNVPLRGVFQAIKIVLYLLATLIIISIAISITICFCKTIFHTQTITNTSR